MSKQSSTVNPAPLPGNDSANLPRTGTSLYGVSVEYALHCLLWLTNEDIERASSRDLADLQGVPAAMLAKIMPQLERAGIVSSKDGIAGGYILARPAENISVLAIIDAVEGGRRLFNCKEIRKSCALFGGNPPAWSKTGLCGIHSLMLRAEKQMRDELAQTSLAELAHNVPRPPQFDAQAASWIKDRNNSRHAARIAAVKLARQKPRQE